MARPTTVSWTLRPEEHAFWLTQARVRHLSVGQCIYVLATMQALEGEVADWALDQDYDALRPSLERIAAMKGRRATER